MNQSRMREIETIIHPSGHGGVGSHLVDLTVSTFRWFMRAELKHRPVNPDLPATPESYTSAYACDVRPSPKLRLLNVAGATRGCKSSGHRLTPPPDVFIGLNIIRALSIISLILVFSSSIMTLVEDVKAFNSYQN